MSETTKEKVKLTDKDYQGVDYITCPYCGYEDYESWDHTGDESDSQECYNDECGKTFRWQRVVDVTYDSFPAKEDKEAEE